MTELKADDLAWSVGGARILDGVDLHARAGEVLGVLGPNGAGKTSLLRILAGLRRPDRGTVELGGISLRTMARRRVAQQLAIVEQSPEAHAEITVDEAVALGRSPHRGTFSAMTGSDRVAIDRALELTGMAGFRSRSWRTLSGGEQQRAQLARALAQQPEIVVLDEPTNHLDIRYQLDVLTLLRQLDLTVITALHDLNLAARFCDQLAVLDRGRVVAAGPPEDVFTTELIRAVYAVETVIEPSPHTGTLSVTYLAPSERSGASRDVSV
ncbi:ABC transporter ATP-binding protein [Microlunatus sp. GCM10028923]|uniref:ABC transporter ATP-binding protein n=1 Tax=Microlunatus sp. GCM10028923 TaxID=3273400 RepID=UPI0036122195